MNLNTQEQQVTLALTNPKSITNVGGVMRAAGCYNAQRVIYSGDRFNYALRLTTDTQKIHQVVPLCHTENILAELKDDMKLVCVELVENAIPLPNFTHPDNAMYLFGPEDSTIKQSVINKADAVVYIPTNGCMNLAATVNVVLYDRLSKSTQHHVDNQLIKNSRDNNNRVKVKVQ